MPLDTQGLDPGAYAPIVNRDETMTTFEIAQR